ARALDQLAICAATSSGEMKAPWMDPGVRELVIGIESKSCSEFRAEEVLLLILEPSAGTMLPHGSNEQMFGSEEQVPHGGQNDQEAVSLPAARRNFGRWPS